MAYRNLEEGAVFEWTVFDLNRRRIGRPGKA